MSQKYWRFQVDGKIKIDQNHGEPIRNPLTPQEQLYWRLNVDDDEEKEHKFIYRVPSNIELDVIWTGSEIDIFSSRLISIFDSLNVKYKTYQTELITRDGIKVDKNLFRVFRLLELQKALDQNKTVIGSYKVGSMEFENVDKIVLTNGILNSELHLFRLEEQPHIVLISDVLRLLLLENDIKGFIFLDL